MHHSNVQSLVYMRTQLARFWSTGLVMLSHLFGGPGTILELLMAPICVAVESLLFEFFQW